MRPYILAETNWKNIKDSDFELAVLPWGATEAHNYHLPYSSDIIEAEFIAHKSAEKAYNRGKYFTENWVWTERKWSEISSDTGVGNPEAASREKGEKYFNVLTEKIGDMLLDICKKHIQYLDD